MHNNSHIYIINYDRNEKDLCRLECRYVFGKEENDKVIFSDLKVEPSCSAFIRKRLDIILFSENYSTLVDDIKEENIRVEGFKAEYLVLEGDETEYTHRLDKLKDIGCSIEGIPDYYNPKINYGLCCYMGIWYFGIVKKNDVKWHEHKQKPCSYSISIDMNIAKALVNIAADGDKGKKLLDACCGVGTIMLEACFAGYELEGCDINHKICHNARENLKYFNYKANVICSDIKDITSSYDAVIVDLPYNLFSTVDDAAVLHIIQSAAQLAQKLVIVSASDISTFIAKAGLQVSDHCSVKKKGKANFAREIWVCERDC